MYMYLQRLFLISKMRRTTKRLLVERDFLQIAEESLDSFFSSFSTLGCFDTFRERQLTVESPRILRTKAYRSALLIASM